MADNPLLDGALSIKVAGVEYAAVAGALQFETVAPGGFGPASFEVYPDDPFGVPATYPELVNEAAVVVKRGDVEGRFVLVDANIIPTMTSNTAPSGIASTSGVYTGDYLSL